MKYIRVVSDLHLDFDPEDDLWLPPALAEDHLTCMVIPGDLWVAKKFRKTHRGRSWLKDISSQFKYVVIVLGNHDFYDGNVSIEYKKLQKFITEQNFINIHVLHNSQVELDHIKFVGGTLWSDYNRCNPIATYTASQQMRCFKKIRVGANYKRFAPNDAINEFLTTKNYIFEKAFKNNEDQKVIVITHMAPSLLSLSTKYDNDMTNYHYATELGNEIAGSEIDFWFHGHVHETKDYVIGSTRIVCNPRGYRDVSEFNPYLRFEV